MNPEKDFHNEFLKSAGFFLDAAEDAATNGQARLAIHLFCAAFEISEQEGLAPAPRVLEGLRKAWALAFEQGDRSTAEAIFGELLPYNSSEQTEQGMLQLQELAVNQLEEMGLSKADLEGMAQAVSSELAHYGGEEMVNSLRGALDRLGAMSKPELGIQKTPNRDIVAANTVDKDDKSGGGEPKLTYTTLAGYDTALERMQEFGFLAAGDGVYRQFVEQTAAMHGLSGLALMDHFVFYGPSREDVAIFAHATAGEIGWPVLDMQIDLDLQGNGSIKLSGPFKRNLFGPPDLAEISTPCVLLIENIDYLQDMFSNEQRAMSRDKKVGPGHHGRSMQTEVMGYLRALLYKNGIFLIATAERPGALREPLLSLIGSHQEIEIGSPTRYERGDILNWFASEHPSFTELDFDELSRLSEGVSRHDLVMASRAAVESAYRESLKSGWFHKVSFSEVLAQLVPLVDHDAPIYQQLEDAAVAQFTRDLEKNG
jgi:hypothetical protein